MARSSLEEHAPDVTREIMGRLSPEAMRTLRAVSEMRNRPAEDVLREELRGYIADKLPLPDVEAIIHAMGERFYALGYACGTAKRFLRKRQSFLLLFPFLFLWPRLSVMTSFSWALSCVLRWQ